MSSVIACLDIFNHHGSITRVHAGHGGFDSPPTKALFYWSIYCCLPSLTDKINNNLITTIIDSIGWRGPIIPYICIIILPLFLYEQRSGPDITDNNVTEGKNQDASPVSSIC